MDENKRTKLTNLGYQIPRVCGLCAHATLTWGDPSWGSCAKVDYDHRKHTKSARPLSISEYGSCPLWEPSEARLHRLHGFRDFVEGE